MKRTTSTAGLFVTAFVLYIFTLPPVMSAQGHGCGGHGSSGAPTHGSPHQDDGTLLPGDVPFAPVIAGVQTVTVAVATEGYMPSQVRLRSGLPARILFDQRASGQCPSQVQIPTLEVEKTNLPYGEVTAINFTPGRTGRYQFTCGMKMLSGLIIVDE
jgi:hypothetical protein